MQRGSHGNVHGVVVGLLIMLGVIMLGLLGCSDGADEVDRGPINGTGPSSTAPQQPVFQDIQGQACCPVGCTRCRVCTIGKPCGDTCITVTDTCHVPPGCACQG